MRKIFSALAVAATVAFGGNALAATLVTETFTYPDGNLTDNPAWTAHSGAASTEIQVTSGEAVLVHGSGTREDAGINFASQNSGILTATFDLTVTDDAPITGTDFEYFAHFMEDGTFDFRSRVDVVAGNSGGDYSLGLATGAGTAEVTWGSDLTYGTTYSIALGFDFANGLSTLSVNGSPAITSTTVFAGEVLDRFALRQSNSSSDETIVVDNLTISQVPSPTGLAAVFSLGLCGTVFRRRRS